MTNKPRCAPPVGKRKEEATSRIAGLPLKVSLAGLLAAFAALNLLRRPRCRGLFSGSLDGAFEQARGWPFRSWTLGGDAELLEVDASNALGDIICIRNLLPDTPTPHLLVSPTLSALNLVVILAACGLVFVVARCGSSKRARAT